MTYCIHPPTLARRAPDVERLRDVLVRAAAVAHIDLYSLRNMPLSWDGGDNPFARLPHQRGADDVGTLRQFERVDAERRVR